MQVTRILLVRHGETAWNADGRIQGHLDEPLSPVGQRQAARLAQSPVASEPLHAIYSSDLSRAMQTAQPLAARLGLSVQPSAALRERHFGRFQGARFADIATQWPDDSLRWRKRDPDWAPPEGGESLRQMRTRILDTVHALAARHLGQHIGIFTHGGVLDLLYRAATGLDLQDARTWQLANAAINRLLWTPDSGLTLVGWADTAHLDSSALDERTT